MSTVRTWADGFGRWYAEADSEGAAVDAIESELDARMDRSPEYVVSVEPAPEYGPNVWREV